MFKVGDVVRWTSQSQSFVKTKTGKVLAVLEAGKVPIEYDIGLVDYSLLRQLLGDFWYLNYSPKNLGGGSARNHESYLIAVQGPKKDLLYWPRVDGLEKVDAST